MSEYTKGVIPIIITCVNNLISTHRGIIIKTTFTSGVLIVISIFWQLINTVKIVTLPQVYKLTMGESMKSGGMDSQ